MINRELGTKRVVRKPLCRGGTTLDKITAIYMRAIIDDDDGYLSEEQRILEDYAESHSLINTQFFCDIGYSADDQNRPEYNRMMAAVNGDEIGIILTYDSAKLCGSLVALYDTMNHMRKKGVRVIFLHDNARILVNDIHDQGIGWNSHIINRYNLPELSDWEYEKKNGDAIGF